MNKSCARCSKIVYPIEELKCLDKVGALSLLMTSSMAEIYLMSECYISNYYHQNYNCFHFWKKIKKIANNNLIIGV